MTRIAVIRLGRAALVSACFCAVFCALPAAAQERANRGTSAERARPRSASNSKGKRADTKAKRARAAAADKRAAAAGAPAAASSTAAEPAAAANEKPTPTPPPASAGRAETSAPSVSPPSATVASGAEEPGEVRTEGDTQVKVMEFSGLDIEGQLKTPQMLYFLNRLRAEFGHPRLPHRSFMPELQLSTRGKAF
jgi:hypothetical protein